MDKIPKNDRRAIFSWCLYDFANSAFTTLIVTFVFATYFTEAVADNTTEGTALWSRGVTLTAIMVAFLSPFLGAISDRGGYRKLFLFITTAICVIGSILLYFVTPGHTMMALIIFVIANIAYELGCVFYNAFLPDICTQNKIGRVSGYGWSFGYVGGLLALVLALIGFVQPETAWFGVTKENFQHVRATNILVAVWFAIFSIPIFIWVKEDRSRVSPTREKIISATANQLKKTFHEIRRYKQIVTFLFARLIYNDGLITVFFFGGIYAAGTFYFSTSERIFLGIVLNVCAGAGAFALGFLDDWLGGKRTIQISLIGLILATFLAVIAPNGSLTLQSGDLREVSGLAVQLSNQDDSVTTHIYGRLSSSTQQSLNEYDGSTPLPEALQSGLIEDLNRMIRSDDFYQEEQFSAVALREKTKELIERNPENEDLYRLHRYLLEDAFPEHIVTFFPMLFWIAGIIIGIFVGPNQSASRSLMGRFVPPDKENEFFGFFAFSGKATAFMGPFLLGIFTTLFESQRAGIAVVIAFFIVGGIVLFFVDEEEGIRIADRG